MIQLIGWCGCPDCGAIDYRNLLDDARRFLRTRCMYLFCGKDDPGDD